MECELSARVQGWAVQSKEATGGVFLEAVGSGLGPED